MKGKKHIILQNLIYILIWIIVILVPIFGYRFDTGLSWEAIRFFWIAATPFFIIFLINNYFLVPVFLLRKRYLYYLLTCAATISCVLAFNARLLDNHRETPRPSREEMRKMLEENYMRQSQDSATFKTPPAYPMHFGNRPMPIKWGPILNFYLIAVLLVGFNAAIRLLFKSIDDSERFTELEKEKLRSELKYLKAQVNPHFFMNTLNNIHALIDINGDKAKQAVIELSRIMRYVLYQGEQPLVNIEDEIEFIKTYVCLMKIRYSDDVIITSEYPQALPPTLQIPPLLFIVLIENAFKHGVSYQNNSYIRSRMTLEKDSIVYRVENSRAPKKTDVHGGVGIANLRKRLELIYGTRYKLEINAAAESYTATLTLPIWINK